MLFTDCILAPVSNKSLRISVMSRHTLNDGITPDLRLKNWDIHIPKLGPSPRLIGDYYKRDLSWEGFAKRYLEEIRDESNLVLVHFIASLALNRDISLLCIEHSHINCHRSLLAAECERLYPKIEVVHY
jgi:uncharacterized protein YeaO (DUF488 family)